MDAFHFIPVPVTGGPASPAGRSAERALDTAREAREAIDALGRQVDRLQLICEALWTVLKRRSGAADEELVRLVEEIDLRDGKLDGRFTPAPRKCARCDKVVSVRTGVCLYCGTPSPPPGVFGGTA